jgi:hypothetical protein
MVSPLAPVSPVKASKSWQNVLKRPSDLFDLQAIGSLRNDVLGKLCPFSELCWQQPAVTLRFCALDEDLVACGTRQAPSSRGIRRGQDVRINKTSFMREGGAKHRATDMNVSMRNGLATRNDRFPVLHQPQKTIANIHPHLLSFIRVIH